MHVLIYMYVYVGCILKGHFMRSSEIHVERNLSQPHEVMSYWFPLLASLDLKEQFHLIIFKLGISTSEVYECIFACSIIHEDFVNDMQEEIFNLSS